MVKRTLIIGGSGLLGRYLLHTAPALMELYTTYNTNYIDVGYPTFTLDITNVAMLKLLLDRVKPHYVILAAAAGSVDWCDRNYQDALKVNVRGVENVVEAANLVGSKFIFISSNAVYKGDSPYYHENSQQSPVNRYGMMKREAEAYVRKHSHSYAIVRPIMLFGWPWPGGRANWATLTISKLRAGEPLYVVNDTVTQPTYALDCARAIWYSLELDNQSVNVAHPVRTNLYKFTCAVADLWELDKSLISPVNSSHFPKIARRPIDTSYDISKLTSMGFEFSVSGLRHMRSTEHDFSSNIHP